jgi:hypothetical protein
VLLWEALEESNTTRVIEDVLVLTMSCITTTTSSKPFPQARMDLWINYVIWTNREIYDMDGVLRMEIMCMRTMVHLNLDCRHCRMKQMYSLWAIYRSGIAIWWFSSTIFLVIRCEGINRLLVSIMVSLHKKRGNHPRRLALANIWIILLGVASLNL